MNIIKVIDAKLEKRFLDVPTLIYKEDANYIPHLVQDVKKVFNPSENKMFRHGKAERWILESEGKTIGRIAAFVNQKYAKGMEQPTGGIGFFECIDDSKASRLLFDMAYEWLKEEGMEAVDGPINFGEKDRFWGLLVDNFTSINSYAMNYNPPYYKRFFEQEGFQVYYEQYIYWRDMYVPVQDVFVEKSERIAKNPDYTIRNIRGKSWDQVAEDFRTVYNNAWGGHHGFKAMPEVQAKKIIQALKPVVDRDIIIFVEHKGKPIGFYVNIPELNQIFNKVNGNLNLIGKLKFLYHKWKRPATSWWAWFLGLTARIMEKELRGR